MTPVPESLSRSQDYKYRASGWDEQPKIPPVPPLCPARLWPSASWGSWLSPPLATSRTAPSGANALCWTWTSGRYVLEGSEHSEPHPSLLPTFFPPVPRAVPALRSPEQGPLLRAQHLLRGGAGLLHRHLGNAALPGGKLPAHPLRVGTQTLRLRRELRRSRHLLQHR